jgi:hypothetical protein
MQSTTLAVTHPAKIPLWLKLAFTAFMAVLVPVYWRNYGPTNFLYFCDVALFMTLVAVWTEKPIWASMPAVGILVPQFVWCVDFLGSLVNLPLTGMTAYMFDHNASLFARGLSFFHFWLPFLLVYLVYKLGYERKALLYWTLIAWVLVLICYNFMPAPPAPAGSSIPVNINYVYGIGDSAKQTWMPELAWVGLLFVALPTLFYLPAHFLLQKFFPIVKHAR